MLRYSLLRPIAGIINFCPTELERSSDEYNIQIGIHEVYHALVRETVLAALGKKALHKNCSRLNYCLYFRSYNVINLCENT